MNTGTINRDRPEVAFISFRNAEASLSMPIGSPIAYVMNGTNDGNDCVLPVTATGPKATSLFTGAVIGQAAVVAGAYGVAQVYGPVLQAVLLARTRAATTDSWSSIASINTGVLCNVDTINNAFNRNAAGASSNFLAFAVLAQSVASVAGVASSTSDTLTASTSYAKLFLRAM